VGKTKIAWTDYTFNPWWGCAKVSPGCAHCYAETLARRFGCDVWGARPRRLFGDAHWREPLKWNRDAEQAGERRRVFAGSMCDVFEQAKRSDGLDAERARLFALIRLTPHLDWLLLTKRAENIAAMLPADWGAGYANVWLGVSAENQPAADERIPLLMRVPARVRFVSCEPLIEYVDLKLGAYRDQPNSRAEWIHWVIVGGESGPNYRAMDLDWARSLRGQCARTGVAFFFKQESGARPGTNPMLDGVEHHQFPNVER